MKQQILTQFPWPWLPAAALLIFFVFFVLMIVRLLLESQKPVQLRASHLALEEGEIHERL